MSCGEAEAAGEEKERKREHDWWLNNVTEPIDYSEVRTGLFGIILMQSCASVCRHRGCG